MPLRKACGYFLLLIFLIVYAVAVVMLGELILGKSPVWSLLFYGISGLAVVYPCTKILDWSHRSDRL